MAPANYVRGKQSPIMLNPLSLLSVPYILENRFLVPTSDDTARMGRLVVKIWTHGTKDLRFHSTFSKRRYLSRGRFRVIDKLFSGVADNSSQFASEESSLADRELRSASWHFCYKHESLLMLKHLRSITSLNMKFNSPQTLRILSLILNNFIIKSCVNLPSQT